MAFKDEKIKLFIHADCDKTFNDKELSILKDNFENLDINGYSTFACEIIGEPSFIMLTTKFRIPDLWGNNKTHFEDELLLSSFMTIDEVKTLNYFEYGEEHIHGVVNQEKTLNAGEPFDVASSFDLLKVSDALLEYLKSNNLLSSLNKEDIIEEFKKVKLLSELALKYNLDIFFLPDVF
jgi:hypothetical protein